MARVLLPLCGLAGLMIPIGAAMAAGGNATSPWYQFSQPGLSREQVLADLEECRDLAGRVQPPRTDSGIYAPDPVGAGTVGFLEGLQRGEQRRNMATAAWRKCMAIKGYVRFAISKDQAKSLYAGNWDQQRERLADRALAAPDGLQRLDP